MPTTEQGRFHPAGRPYRFVVLAFASVMLFGNYFAYDSVGAIETTLIQVFHTNRAAIGTMYTMYSVAAVFAVLIGGFLIDRAGVRLASLIFASIVVVGAAVVDQEDRCAKRHHRALVQGQGTGPGLRHCPHYLPLGHTVFL